MRNDSDGNYLWHIEDERGRSILDWWVLRFSYEIKEQIYTGSEINPNICIKDGNYTLIENKDYKLEYLNNKKCGEAKIKITCIGNYVGSLEKTFKIIPPKVNNFKVEKVIFNCGEFNQLEQALIKVLDKKKIKYYSCIKELNIDNNKLYFLQTKEYDNENDNSSVIYTELNGYKFMFMGDAGIEKEKDILEKYNISNIDVLKVGHHGSKTSSSKIFIDEIEPKYSIISVGKNNRYGHPNKEVLNILDESEYQKKFTKAYRANPS